MLRMLLRFPKGIFDGAHHENVPPYAREAPSAMPCRALSPQAQPKRPAR